MSNQSATEVKSKWISILKEGINKLRRLAPKKKKNGATAASVCKHFQSFFYYQRFKSLGWYQNFLRTYLITYRKPLINFLRTSYELLAKFLGTFWKLLMSMLRTSLNFLKSNVWVGTYHSSYQDVFSSHFRILCIPTLKMRVRFSTKVFFV